MRTRRLIGSSIWILMLITSLGCEQEQSKRRKVSEVTSFQGQQVTGVTVSDKGRVFANFPRWREGVKNAVVEVLGKNKSEAYPNKKWNAWEVGMPLKDSVFVAVQSVVALDNELYVLDTRNPLFKGVLDNPRVFVFDLALNQLKRTYLMSASCFHQDSYLNDLRVDTQNHKVYFTDSGHPGLVILDLESGISRRVLNEHSSTSAETDHLTFDKGDWNKTVHSDGIALDTVNNMLYYHALTGYGLYAVPTKVLIEGTQHEVEKSVRLVKTTSAPDGMIIDKSGNLYLADLENSRIMKLNIETGAMSVFVEGKKVKWADTFSIYDGHLYYTNSRINEVKEDISNMIFTINKVNLD